MPNNSQRFDAAVAASDLTPSATRIGWRILITVVLLLLVAILSILLQGARNASAAPLLQSTGDPLVVALYYPWFDDATWTYDQLSDLPAAPYVSRDRAVMGRQIDQAKAAGIDAFIVAWYGPDGDGNQTEANLSALLDEAAARNFKIGILFETNSPYFWGVDGVSSALQHALQVHASHPAFLRADGKPVIFFWQTSDLDVGTWGAIRNQVDPGNGSLWIAEGIDPGMLSVFDGLYLYSNTWNPPADLGATNQKFANSVEAMSQSTGTSKLWVATVMPGYNDVRIRPNSGFARDRAGGAYYAESWQAALASGPNWVVVTSFNEWPEGTYIEPSAAYGDQYLGLTAQWSAQFKAGGGQRTALVVAPEETPSTAPAEPDSPTAYVDTFILNLRAGPGTAYDLLGTAPQGAELALTGRLADDASWWQVDSEFGPAWVFAELVHVAGPLDEVPVVAVDEPPPSEQTAGASGLTVTIDGASILLRQVLPTNR